MTPPSTRRLSFLISILFLTGPIAGNLHAEAKKRKPAEEPSKNAPAATATPAESNGPEEADIKKIKEKYWTRGNEEEVGVVQNRIFTKRRKIELGLDVATIYGDPFLTTRALTLNAGYYFDEYKSVHLLFSKQFVSGSTALTDLERQSGETANTNEPNYYLAAEGHYSLLYGKVSLLGLTILHFDAYLSGGLGMINTESGSDFLLTGGVGQILHITRTVGITLSYKLLWYRERILGKVAGTNGMNGNLGQYLTTRSNMSSMMTVGVSILLDPFPPAKGNGEPKSPTT